MPDSDSVYPITCSFHSVAHHSSLPPHPLPLLRFLIAFVRNPLCSLPQAVYEEPIVVHDNGRSVVAWLTDPALVERVLLHDSEMFPKTPLEKRVFAHTLGDGILTSQGASWK